MVHAYAYHKVGDYQEAQDIAQEVFIKAYSKLGQLKSPHKFQSWLYTIVSNECKMWLRKHSKEREQKVYLEDAPADELTELAMRAHSDEEMKFTVKNAMGTLPADNQLALSLYYMSDLSVKEVANFMGISPNTVKGKLHRARKQLGERLENMLGKQLELEKLKSGFIFAVVDSIKNMPIPSVPKPSSVKWTPIPLPITAVLLIGIIGFGLSFGGGISSDISAFGPIEDIPSFEVSLLSTFDEREVLSMKSASENKFPATQNTENRVFAQNIEAPPRFTGSIPDEPMQIIGNGRVDGVAVSPDGILLAVQTPLGIELSDVERKTKPVLLEASRVRDIAFSRDGKFLVGQRFLMGPPNSEILVWDVHEQRLIQTLPFDRTLLGSIGEAFQMDLDNRNISEELRKAFENNGIVLSQNAAVRKKGEAWYVFNLDRDLLFSVDLKYKVDLDKGSLSKAFLKEFEDSGIPFPEEHGVHKQSNRWIIGGPISYSARLDEDKLNIYNIHRDEVYIVRKESGKLNIFYSKISRGHILGMALNPASSEVAVAFGNGEIMIIDPISGHWLRSLYWHRSSEWGTSGSRISMQYSPDAQQLFILESSAASGKPDRIIVFDPHSGDTIHTISTSSGMSAAYSPDSRWLAVRARTDRCIEVRDTTDWKVKHVFEMRGGSGRTQPITFSPDGHYIALGDVVWDFHTKELIRDGWYSPYCQWIDNTRLLAGDWKSLQILDMTNYQPPQQIAEYTGVLWSAYFFMHDKYILTNANGLTLWDADTGRVLETGIRQGNFWPKFTAVSHTHPHVAIPDNKGKCVQVWDAVKRDVIRRIPYDGKEPHALAFSPDGKWLAVGENSYTTKLWNINTGEKLHQFLNAEGLSANRIIMKFKQWRHQHENPTKVRALAFSSDGRYLACASGDENIWIWNTRTGKLVRRLAVPIEDTLYRGKDTHPHTMFLQFSADGKRLFAGLAENRVDVWEVASGKLIKSVTTHYSFGSPDSVYPISLAFNPNATLMAIGTRDSTVEVIDTDTWQRIAELKGHGAYISSVDFSSDGTKLLTASGGGTMRVWKITEM